MHVLMSIRPFFGHFHPFVPLARAAVAAGHQVTFATAEPFCSVVTAAGFRAVPAGIEPGDAVLAEHLHAPYARDYGRYTVSVKTAQLVQLGRGLGVDVLVRDPTDVAGVVAAEVLSIPQVTLGFSIFIPPASWDILIGGQLDDVRAEYGLSSDPSWERMHPYLYIDTVPSFFQEPADPIPVRRVIAPHVSQTLHDPPEPSWLTDHAPGLTVYVTLGTAYNGRPNLLRRLVAGAAAAGRRVVVATGPGVEPARVLPNPPPHVRVEQFVPQTLVLQSCDVVVTAGGYNTVIGALRYGRPLLAVPLGSDQPRNAGRAASLGVAIVRSVAEAEPHTVAADLRSLVEDPAYRVRAARLEEECLQLPPPSDGVRWLERLARSHEPLPAET